MERRTVEAVIFDMHGTRIDPSSVILAAYIGP
jgi:hypothetical protein